jgi:hypothetical protein
MNVAGDSLLSRKLRALNELPPSCCLCLLTVIYMFRYTCKHVGLCMHVYTHRIHTCISAYEHVHIRIHTRPHMHARYTHGSAIHTESIQYLDEDVSDPLHK